MNRLNPFQKIRRRSAPVELRDRIPLTIPLVGALPDDSSQITKCSSYKTEVIVLSSFEQPGFLRHQTTQTREEDRDSARKSFVRGECPGFSYDKIRSGDISVKV